MLVFPEESVRKDIALLIQSMVQETGIPVIHVNCLGDFRVFVNRVEVLQSQWKTRKAENLFKYLIVERHQHHKEKIIEELWPESDLRLGDASLRMALTHVRKALGLNDYVEESVILRRGMIFLNPDIEIFTDYVMFTAIAQNALLDKPMDNPVKANLLEQAAELYRGDFLPDNLYDDWTNKLRMQLQHLYLQVLLKLVEFYHRQEKPAQTIQACRRYLILEPADEHVSRTAMELLWQSGKKQQALSLYQELASVLVREYGANPDAETISLYEKIRCS